MEVIDYCKMTAERGGHYCTAHPINHMTRLQCREDVLKQILADNELKKGLRQASNVLIDGGGQSVLLKMLIGEK